jgi:glycosyltransferase involved in cell wall biosynthesis
MPKVSVVIPTYNHAPFLKKALESVCAQTMDDWEAIIVNNYSEDDTVAVVEAINDPRISLINFRNDGVIAASRNVGIKKAQAPWVAFLDSDDLWRPNKLALCLADLNEDTDVISHPEIIIRDGLQQGATKTGSAARAAYKCLLFDGNIFSPSAILVKKDLLEKLSGFSEDPQLITAEDYDLWLRIAKSGVRVRFLADHLSEYTLHEANSINAFEKHLAANLTVLDRHYTAIEQKSIRDGLRYRRAKALTIYGAGRLCHNTGNPAQALKYFGQAFLVYPLILKLYVAISLSVIKLAF